MTDLESGGGGDGRPVARDRRRDARLVLTGVAAVLLVWFAIINTRGVRIDFWLSRQTAPLIVVIVIAGLLGSAVTMLVSYVARSRHRPDE